MSSFFEEIKTQPAMLSNMLKQYSKSKFKLIIKAADKMKTAQKIIFCGMGTSFFAPNCILSRLRKIKEAFCLEAAEMAEDCTTLVKKGDVIILLSQSGESIEVLNILKKLKTRKVFLISITNNPNSALATASDMILELYAGEELSITNKTFTNTLALLYLLEAAIEGAELNSLSVHLEESCFAMQDIITNKLDMIESIAQDFHSEKGMLFIGRKGISTTIANQSALIFMEGAAIYTRAFSTGAFRHGPIEICSDRHKLIVYNCNDDEQQIMTELEKQITNLGSMVYVVTNMETNAQKCFKVQAKDSMQYSLVVAVFMEILLMYVAKDRGRIAGKFNITKKICIAE